MIIYNIVSNIKINENILTQTKENLDNNINTINIDITYIDNDDNRYIFNEFEIGTGDVNDPTYINGSEIETPYSFYSYFGHDESEKYSMYIVISLNNGIILLVVIQEHIDN